MLLFAIPFCDTVICNNSRTKSLEFLQFVSWSIAVPKCKNILDDFVFWCHKNRRIPGVFWMSLQIHIPWLLSVQKDIQGICVFWTFQTGFRERKVHVIQLKTGKHESISIMFRKLIIISSISIILCLSFYKFKITLKTASKIFLRRRIACHLIWKWFSIPVILLKG